MKQAKTKVPQKNGVYAFLAYWKMLADKRLPQPVQEYQFAKAQGRKWAFDLAWPDKVVVLRPGRVNQYLPKGRVAVEIEGGLYIQGRHSRGAGYERDLAKDNAAVVMLWHVLRFSPGMLERNPQDCISQVEALLK